MSIIDNLITDRSQSDVDAIRTLLARGKANWTAKELAEFNLARSKGAYNYTDLNRVTEAMDYINDRLVGYGYSTGYQKVEVPHEEEEVSYNLTNIIPNSSFEQNTDWSGISYDTTEAYQGVRASKLSGTTVTTTGQVSTPIVGHKYYGRSYIKSQGNIQPADCRFEWFAGDGAGLNFVFAWNQGDFPDWTMQSAVVSVDAVNGTSYIIRNFVVNAVNPCWTDCLMIVDLTAAFGAGNEPDKAWCDANIPYFDGQYTYTPPPKDLYTWYEDDIPTKSLMNTYISNVAALRSVLEVWATTPPTPDDMAGLTYQEANDIEQILVDVESVINQVVAAMARSNSFTFWSGNRPFPTAESNLGRTWNEFDAMEFKWSDLDNANWYIWAYGDPREAT